jgi:protein-tyrosine-phosphatase
MSHHAGLRRLLLTGTFLALASTLASAADSGDAKKTTALPTVAFVCSHGTIKSLAAAQMFNQMAVQRGIPVQAISRAANADTVDEVIPNSVAREMVSDGYYVDEIKPKVLTHEEASKALRVVHISLEDIANDPDSKALAGVAVERWDGIPSGLRDYPTMRKMIKARIEAMLEHYAATQVSAAKE